MIQKFMVEKSRFEKSGVERSRVEGVEKFGVEMSFNHVPSQTFTVKQIIFLHNDPYQIYKPSNGTAAQ